MEQSQLSSSFRHSCEAIILCVCTRQSYSLSFTGPMNNIPSVVPACNNHYALWLDDIFYGYRVVRLAIQASVTPLIDALWRSTLSTGLGDCKRCFLNIFIQIGNGFQGWIYRRTE